MPLAPPAAGPDAVRSTILATVLAVLVTAALAVPVLTAGAAAAPLAASGAASKTKPPRVSIGNVAVPEGSAGASYVGVAVELTKTNGKKTKVWWRTVDGTAKAGSDYVAGRGKLVFSGRKASQGKAIDVKVIGDRTVESSETFSVELTKVRNGKIKRSTATVTLKNDDTATPPPPPPTSMITVSFAGSGSGTVTSAPSGVDCDMPCQAIYPRGTEVTLTAVAESGSQFTGWGGDCAGDTCVVDMAADRMVTATFEKIRYELTVGVSGQGLVSATTGGIACPSDCSETYDQGTMVTLVAGATSESSAFSSWQGPCVVQGNQCTVEMSQARSVTAVFGSLVNHALTVSKGLGGVGTGTVTGAGIECGSMCLNAFANLSHGSVVVLTATPDPGMQFVGWSGDCTGTEATCTLTMTEDRVATATFVLLSP